MIAKPDDLPSDLASALAALQAEREARLRAEAVAASARAELSDNAALIAHLELRIEKLKRELYGQRSERTARLIEQLELELEELATTASEDELAAQAAAAKAQTVRANPCSSSSISANPIPVLLAGHCKLRDTLSTFGDRVTVTRCRRL